MVLTSIAAFGENNELGKDNALLWHLPLDFKRFKSLTESHNIIMGRKTFESLPGMLPNRKHIIITRQEKYITKNDDVCIVKTFGQALDISSEDKQPFVIGGGEIYRLAMPYIKKIELTRVHESFPQADTYFPEITKSWKCSFFEKHQKDDTHKYDYTFETYEFFV